MARQPRYDPNHPQLIFYLNPKLSDLSIVPKCKKSLLGRKIPDSIPAHRLHLMTHPLFPQLWIPDQEQKGQNGTKDTPPKLQKELPIECEYLETIEALLWCAYTNQELKKLPEIHKRLTTDDILNLVNDILIYWTKISTHKYSYEDIKGFEENAIAPYWRVAKLGVDWNSDSEANKKRVKMAIEICAKYDSYLNLRGAETRTISWDLLKSIDAKNMEAWAKNMEIPEVAIAWCCCANASVEQIKNVLNGIVYYEKEDDERKEYKISLDKDSFDLCYSKKKTLEVVEFVAEFCIVERASDPFPDTIDTSELFVYRPLIDIDDEDEDEDDDEEDNSGEVDEYGNDDDEEGDDDEDDEDEEGDEDEDLEEEVGDIEKIDRTRKPRPRAKPAAATEKKTPPKSKRDKDEDEDEDVVDTDEDEAD